jgi:hypothetical protein
LSIFDCPYVACYSGLSILINVREYRRGNAKGQSREIGNIGYTRHRTNKC